MIVLSSKRITLGGTLVIVECNAGGEHVDERKSRMAHAGLNQWYELGLVSGKTARDKRGAQRQSQYLRIDGCSFIHVAALRLGADIGRRGELALGQAVHAVVFDQVE